MVPAHPLKLPFDRQVAAWRQNFPRALLGGVEPLHQSRVATRRLREILPVCSAGEPLAAAKKARRQVRLFGRTMGKMRELDVTTTIIGKFEETRPAAVEHLRYYLRDARSAERARLLARLDGRKAASFERVLDEISERLRAPRAPEAWRKALAARLVQRTRRLREAVAAAGALYVPDRVHAVRISLKKLRYALELARDTGVRGLPGRLAQLKTVQETLGRLIDLETAQRYVRAATLAGKPDAPWVAGLERLRLDLERTCRQLHGRFVPQRLLVLGVCDVARQAASRIVRPHGARRRGGALKMSWVARAPLARGPRPARRADWGRRTAP